MRDILLVGLASGPKVIERLLRVFPADRLDERPNPDKFTVRETIAHLADYEQFILDRFRMAKSRPGTQVEAYDPDERCASHHFGDKEVFHEAEVFESRRATTIEFVRELSDAELNNTFKFADGREISAIDYVSVILAHDLSHLDSVSSYLATEVATHI